TPRLQHPQDAVELARQALAATADAAFEPGDLAFEPLDGRSGTQLGVELALARDGMLGEREAELVLALVVASRRQRVVAHARLAQPFGGLATEGGVARSVRLRQLDGADAARRRVEVVGSEAHDVAGRAQRDDPRTA